MSFSARTLMASCQTAFFQCCSLPEKAVQSIGQSDIDREAIRGLSQWRLDFPEGRTALPDSRISNVLAVAEQLLTRGSVTYCMPELDATLSAQLPSDEVELAAALRAAAAVPGIRFAAR
jgi:hypothetical protein